MTVYEEVEEVFPLASEITVYTEGKPISYSKGSKAYAKILEAWLSQLKGSRQMPAFGVSIDNYTREEMKKGLWVEFSFENQMECSGMPFDKLLIGVVKEFRGVNIIRHIKKSGYDGRCYYIDFDNKDMSDFYAILADI